MCLIFRTCENGLMLCLIYWLINTCTGAREIDMVLFVQLVCLCVITSDPGIEDNRGHTI